MATKKTTTEENIPAADISNMNIWAKLSAVRSAFYAAGAKKTGKNLHAEFMYFELEDIVPIAEKLFSTYGLFLKTTFSTSAATAEIIDISDPDEGVTFSIPLVQMSEPAKFRMNEVQAMGAVVTYYRRYLYMLILDLVEADGFDGQSGDQEDAKVPLGASPKKSKPVTKEERQVIKKELTDTSANADELQITALKTALKKVMELDPEQESFVQELAIKTEGFTRISKENCEILINGVKDMIDAYGSKNA